MTLVINHLNPGDRKAVAHISGGRLFGEELSRCLGSKWNHQVWSKDIAKML
jgi:hypothetical protein